ncbi:protein OS-9 [Patella vulgata]|uniref:protein OS-9 n=1 Tax=Patella vulgata TaxID=6465 RepID=UPI0024A84D49|nr:protein OS-9 [Patella vulgata]
METSACLIKTRDWWSYEFCYKKHIRQFHLEDGKIKGDVIFIGQYESDFDWNNETLTEQKLKNSHALNRYHSQKYVNGSKCELTNGFRSAEVRFICEDTVNDYISRIDEPQTCAYILTVHTNKICNHPHLKPASPKTPVPITCNPLVDQQQYNDYLLDLAAEEERRKEAELKERIAQLENEKKDRLTQLETEKQARLQDAEIGDDQTVLTGRTETHRVVGDSSKALDVPQLEKAIHKAFDKEINKIEEQTGTESTDMKMSIKVIENMEDLESVLREQLTEAQKQKTAKLRKSSKIDKDRKKEESEIINRQKENLNTEKSDDENKEKTDEDEEIIGQFQQEIDEVKKVFQAQDPEIKDQISESVRSQFETIINEILLGSKLNEMMNIAHRIPYLVMGIVSHLRIYYTIQNLSFRQILDGQMKKLSNMGLATFVFRIV